MTKNDKEQENLSNWKKSFEKETKKSDAEDFYFSTDEEIDIKPLYTKEDLNNLSFEKPAY